jgi:hypothetical protein
LSPKTEGDLKEVAKHLESLLESLVAATTHTEVHLTKLNSENESQKEDLKKLTTIVIDGNGSPPLLTRIALIEQKLTDISEEIKDSKAKIWQLIMAAFPGIVGVILGVSAM